VEIRNLRAEDATRVISLWNESLRQGEAHSAWYVENYLLNQEKLGQITGNSNFDPNGAFIACDGEQVIGFGIGVVKTVASYEGENLEDLPGYLERLVVAGPFRRRGTGTQILRNVESYVAAAGKRALRISCYQSAIVGMSVLPEAPEYKFLIKSGFQAEGFEIRLMLKLQDFSPKGDIIETRKQLEKNGIQIRYYHDKDQAWFCKLMQVPDFQGWWHNSYQPNLKKETPLPVLIAVDTRKDRVVGFVGFVTVGPDRRAAFSPGVDPEYRKRGIGKVLVNMWAEEVKKLGAQESQISTGTDNLPAQRIYFDMGYEKIGQFCAEMVKRF